MRNEAFRLKGRQWPEPRETIEDEEGVEDDQLLRIEDCLTLEVAIRQLEDAERQLLELRYREDMTQPAIASHLGVPEGTVKVRLHRARKKLHRALSKS